MYSAEQRMKAVETFARFGCSAADTIAELGYPTRHTLRMDWQPFLGHFSQRLRPARSPVEVERLRVVVQQGADALDAGIHEPGRVPEGRPQSLRKMS